jgi:hypothetical protein
MRLIKQFSMVLLRILKLKSDKNYSTALYLINDSYRQILNTNSELINKLDFNELAAHIKTNGYFDKDKCMILSELIYEEGDIYRLQSNISESNNKYIKALNLLLELLYYDKDIIAKKYYSRIDTLIENLEVWNLPLEIKYKLLDYYDFIGSYSKADDLIFNIIEISKEKNNAINRGICFYENLLSYSNDKLEKGNLPRHEVELAMLQLSNIK